MVGRFAVILAFSSILAYVRVNNERAVVRDTYETWRETFVVKITRGNLGMRGTFILGSNVWKRKEWDAYYCACWP